MFNNWMLRVKNHRFFSNCSLLAKSPIKYANIHRQFDIAVHNNGRIRLLFSVKWLSSLASFDTLCPLQFSNGHSFVREN